MIEPVFDRSSGHISGSIDIDDLFERFKRNHGIDTQESELSDAELDALPEECRQTINLMKVSSDDGMSGFEVGSYKLIPSMKDAVVRSGEELGKAILENLEEKSADLESLEIQVTGYTDANPFEGVEIIEDSNKKLRYQQEACPKDVALRFPGFSYPTQGEEKWTKEIDSSTGISNNCELSAARAHEAAKYLYDGFQKIENSAISVIYVAGGQYSEKDGDSESRRIQVRIKYNGLVSREGS